MKKYTLLLAMGIIFVMVAISISVYHVQKEQAITGEELTPSQIAKMIELGVIRVYKNLPENLNDKSVGISVQTPEGTCNLYKDIFGRYYCRW